MPTPPAYMIIHVYYCIYIHTHCIYNIYICVTTYVHIHIHIHVYRHTDIQTYRHTDIQAYRQTYRQADRQPYTHTHIYIHIIINYSYIIIYICTGLHHAYEQIMHTRMRTQHTNHYQPIGGGMRSAGDRNLDKALLELPMLATTAPVACNVLCPGKQ